MSDFPCHMNRNTETRVLASHDLMVLKFEKTMVKLSVFGHNPNSLVDCSIALECAQRLDFDATFLYRYLSPNESTLGSADE